MTPNSLLVEVNPNTSSATIENAKQNLKVTNTALQFSPAYIYQGESIYPTNQIIISLKPNSSIVQVNALFGSQYVSATKNQFGSSYLLTLKDVKDLFSLAENIHQSNLVEWAEPNFISRSIHNPLYPQQYYLNNTGQNGGTPNLDINAPEAWVLAANACSANARIRVAVIDTGAENHADLNNLLPIGYDIRNSANPGRPISPQLRHGQACAGIVGADDNSTGIRGVATNVDILPIKIFYYGIDANGRSRTIAYTDNEIAQSIEWAWDTGQADVLSNSWGGGSSNVAITTAIQRARTLGRNGNGSVVIFSSGNDFGGGVSYPANLPDVIAVGAILNNGALANYSNKGASTDLVAFGGPIPGDIVTLDINNGYRTDFNGTSAACPQVAGVAALMLQANPNLTEVEVRTILQQTARDLGTSGFDNDTGYGLVDAEKAVKRVLFGNTSSLYVSGPSGFCAGGGTGGYYSLSQALPAGATVTWLVTGGLTIKSGQNTPNVGVSGYGGGTIQAIITNCGVSYPTSPFSVAVTFPPYMGVNYVHNNGASMPLFIYSPTNTTLNNICLGYTNRGYLTVGAEPSSIITFTVISGSGVTTSYRSATTAWLNISFGAVGIVRVTATNNCGTEILSMAFKITNCGYPDNPSDPTNPPNPCNGAPKLYNISPNPASGQIKIGISERPVPIECPNNPYPPKMQSMLNSKDGITFSEVNIYNSFGILVLSQKMDKAKEFVIPLNELRAGLYLVQISEGEHTERHQIIIE